MFLLLDVSYLCHRAFHSTRDLEWKQEPTGVVFGFLKAVVEFKEMFQTDDIVFCFDSKKSLRKELFPGYKSKRNDKEWTPEETEKHRIFKDQVDQLQTRWLPAIGFRNIIRTNGYEADDVMASLSRDLGILENVTMVTSDHDLFQCLSPNVGIYSPSVGNVLTDIWFRKKYGIRPGQWVLVKAIAGCHSDNVPGIRGVGELTALRFVKNELDKSSKAFKSIMSKEGKAIVRRNRLLVELPFDGCLRFEIFKDEITKDKWRDVCGQLGMRSLAGRPPVYKRKAGM